jgi:hypothetical protein
MMNDLTIEGREPILVEFAPRPGGVEVPSFGLPTDQLDELSRKALDSAMRTIVQMAHRVRALGDQIPSEFAMIDVEFGIKLDVETGALVAKAGGEAAINVRLTWDRQAQGEDQPAS